QIVGSDVLDYDHVVDLVLRYTLHQHIRIRNWGKPDEAPLCVVMNEWDVPSHYDGVGRSMRADPKRTFDVESHGIDRCISDEEHIGKSHILSRHLCFRSQTNPHEHHTHAAQSIFGNAPGTRSENGKRPGPPLGGFCTRSKEGWRPSGIRDPCRPGT